MGTSFKSKGESEYHKTTEKRNQNFSDWGKKTLVAFRYERLPDFCYVCGKLNHQEHECEEVIKMKKDGRKIHREYGPWLRAEGPGFQVMKGGTSCSKSIEDSASSHFLRSTGGKTMDNNKKGQQSGDHSRRPEEQRRKDKGKFQELMDEAVDSLPVIQGKEQLPDLTLCNMAEFHNPVSKTVEKLPAVVEKTAFTKASGSNSIEGVLLDIDVHTSIKTVTN